MSDVHREEEQTYTFKQIWEQHYEPSIDALMANNLALPAMALTIPCIDAAYQCDTGKRGPADPYSGKDVLTWLVGHRGYHISNLSQDKLVRHLSKHFGNWLKHNAFLGDRIVLHDVFLNGKRAEVPVTVVFNEKTGEITRIMISPTQWWKMVRNIIDQVYRMKPDCKYAWIT